MKKKLLILATGFFVAATSAWAQPFDAPALQKRVGSGQIFPRELKLTDQQKSDMQKIRFDLMQRQIDIRAQIAHDRVDYAQLASAENPDENALDSKVQDIAKLKGEMHSNMLGAWFAVNKLLTPEQQKIWKKVLEHPMAFRRLARMRQMERNRGQMMNMQRRTMMGRGGMMMGGNGPNGPMGEPMWGHDQTPPDSSK